LGILRLLSPTINALLIPTLSFYFRRPCQRVAIDCLTDSPLAYPDVLACNVLYDYMPSTGGFSYFPYQDKTFDQGDYLKYDSDNTHHLGLPSDFPYNYTQDAFSIAGIRARLYLCSGFVDHLRNAILDGAGFPELAGQYRGDLSDQMEAKWLALFEGLKLF